MFTYKNEARFSKAVCEKLREKGYFVQRIESHETGKGIPDIYAVSPIGQAVWIELKRAHKNCPSVEDKIQWRPGQQAWLHLMARRKQMAMTLVCYNDYIARILHDTLYKDCIVARKQMRLYRSLQEI